ncbi:MAG: VWA domain-containing protein, partial [archaeon]
MVLARSGSMSYNYLLSTSGAQGLDRAGDYIYLADGTFGMRTINATDPALPLLSGTYNSPGYGRDVDASGNYAFLADGTGGLKIVSVANPASPTLTSSLAVGGDAYGIATTGNETFLLTYSSSSTPTDVSNLGTQSNNLFIGRSASQLYAAQSFQPAVSFISGGTVRIRKQGSPSGDLVVSIQSTLGGADLIQGTIPSASISSSYQNISFTFPETLPLTTGTTYYLVLTTASTSTSNYYLLGATGSSTYGGGTAYQNTTAQSRDARFETHYIAGLIKVNTSTKTSPIVEGAYPLTDPWRISLSGNTAYVSDGTAGFKLFDVGGDTPSLTGSFDTGGRVYDSIIVGTTAYLADGTSGLRTLDISTPSSPSQEGLYNTPGTAYSVRLDATTAYVADGTSLQVIDVTSPTTPSFLESFATPWNYRDMEIDTVGGTRWAFIAQNSGVIGLVTLNMDTGPKIDQAQVAALTFSDFSGWDENSDQLGLVSYSGSVTTNQTLTHDFSLVETDIASLIASGSTATGSGIAAATDELTSIRHNSSALSIQILMSDGLTNTGTDSATAAIEAANEGIIIYTIGFGSDADTDELTTIADITGGKFYAADDQNALIDVYSLIAQEIQLIATDANIVAGLADGLTIVSDGNGIFGGATIQFDINTLEPPPWTATYTFNIPCTETLACSSTLLSVPSPGTHFEYIDLNGTTQEEVWDVFSTQSFNYRDLNISILSGSLVGSENTDLTVQVQSLGVLDTNATSVSFYEGAPPTNLLVTTPIPPLCGQQNPGCVDYSYEFTQNVLAEGELHAVVNPDGIIPECTFNDQDVIFCYFTPATQFFVLEYWAWQGG